MNSTTIYLIIAGILFVGLLLTLAGSCKHHEANRPPNSDDADEHFDPSSK